MPPNFEVICFPTILTKIALEEIATNKDESDSSLLSISSRNLQKYISTKRDSEETG